MPWLSKYFDQYAKEEITTDLMRSQISCAYNTVSEPCYLELLHIYNGIDAMKVMRDYDK